MVMLDLFIRLPAVTLLWLFAFMCLRDDRSMASRLASLTAISVSALLLGLMPQGFQLPGLLHPLMRLVDIPNLVLVWWLGLALFKDDFRPGLLEWGGALIYCGVVFYLRCVELGQDWPVSPLVIPLVNCVGLLMMIHLFTIIIRGRADDLIERRRRLRLYFASAMALISFLMIGLDTLDSWGMIPHMSLIRAIGAFILALWGIIWLLHMREGALTFESREQVTIKAPSIDPRDEPLKDQLISAIENDKIYTEPGLTIRTLAQTLRTPEHRLRALINQGLGYRNFSAFVNQYRVNAVKAAFSDPKHARTPILTLAMDAGYNSLAPFNRAFRNVEGITPTAYRQALLRKSDQN